MSLRLRKTRKTSLPQPRNNLKKGIAVTVAMAMGLFLLSLILTGESWRAIAYATVVLFGGLIVLAAYFWTTMLFGGIAFALTRRRTPVPWEIDGELAAQEYDIDPGLELVSAGMLVYRYGEIKPTIHFREVPLENARAVRPFIVARTGEARLCGFSFELSDATAHVRFADEFDTDLLPQPQIIAPPVRLIVDSPTRLEGQRWTMQVKSGLTIITSFRFNFTHGNGKYAGNPADFIGDDQLTAHQRKIMPHLLDQILRRDVDDEPQNIALMEDR